MTGEVLEFRPRASEPAPPAFHGATPDQILARLQEVLQAPPSPDTRPVIVVLGAQVTHMQRQLTYALLGTPHNLIVLDREAVLRAAVALGIEVRRER